MTRLQGIFSPVLTPFSADGKPDPDRFLRHCKWLLDQDVGLAAFGTNSEANSLGLQEKRGLLDTLARARGALREGQIERKAAELTRAVRIVDEGLKAALNPAGGELTRQLDGLYGYLSVRLTQANLRNDEAAIAECVALIEPLNEAWTAIRPQVDGPTGRS